MASVIRCRAKLDDVGCLDGEPLERQFGQRGPDEDALHPGEDGTFDGSTIVCDPCYIALMEFTPSGQGLLGELPEAIDVYRHNRAYLVDCDADGLAAAVQEAKDRAANARAGSVMHASANACVHMAQREIARREQLARRAGAAE
ncbi:hypothetical protein [Mycobacterium sp.]|uniref:hypothetical protein n=1 Tax=Mycobacterium sp. TaxID=1785 RepID=UPI002628B0BD|nr:hypothetical protein [Mycobacterium sp.]